MKQIGWGFIGCGEVTEKKSGPAFNEVPGSKVVAVMSRNEAKAKSYAKRHGIKRWYTDPQQLIDDPEVTAVYIATPPSSHATFAIMAMKAGKAQELIYWDRNTRFCGVCGSPMEMDTDISKRCPNCGKTVWPQLATAIIVLINRGDDLLLVHARNFKTDFYGCIAGFVETGESLEEAVRREVMEETQLKIKNLRYFKSQPWPYPCGLMVGFFAEYESGELKLQDEELSRGGWFNKHSLPTIPEKLSLARMLIDDWLERNM